MVTYEENSEAPAPTEPTPTKRLRWATQYKKGKNASRKRTSIMGRLHHRPSLNSEKKRDSAGAESTGTDLENIQEAPHEDADAVADDPDGEGPRNVHFNVPLPPDALDENGLPIKSYRRNKIRTAKYTPISFIPKNLWLQFHNIANVYFLILIILTVRLQSWLLWPSANQILDIQYFWRIRSCTERHAPHSHRVYHGTQGCG
jgi:phospholipid-translocating ATPase